MFLSFTLLVSYQPPPPFVFCLNKIHFQNLVLVHFLRLSIRFEHFCCHLFPLFASICCLFCSHTALQENQEGKHPLQRNTLLHTWHWRIENILTTLEFLFYCLPAYQCKDNCLMRWRANFSLTSLHGFVQVSASLWKLAVMLENMKMPMGYRHVTVVKYPFIGWIKH